MYQEMRMANEDKAGQDVVYTVIPDGWTGVGQFPVLMSLTQALQAAKPDDTVLPIPLRPGEAKSG
jgi:hypothetical protein